MAPLQNSAPSIPLRNCDILPGDKRLFGTDAAIVKVAMLYEHNTAEVERFHESIIGHTSAIDDEGLRNAIAYAKEIRSRDDSVSSFASFLQYREYWRAATNALRLSKQAVSRSREQMGPDPAARPFFAEFDDKHSRILSASVDPAVEFNNFLQSHPLGNLTPYLSYVMYADGPDYQRTHYATANFNGRDIGFGQGFSKGSAKRAAAEKALKFLRSTDVESLLP